MVKIKKIKIDFIIPPIIYKNFIIKKEKKKKK